MNPTGRKEVAEAVAIAALSAIAVKLVDAIAEHLEKRRKARRKAGK
jgi:hypothetical protein